LILFLIILQETVSPPVTQKKNGHEDNKVDDKDDEDPVSSELCSVHVTMTVLEECHYYLEQGMKFGH
jgi:hypothetical protein